VAIGEKIEDFRDRIYDAGSNFFRRLIPDTAGHADRGNRKEASQLLERGRKAYNAKNYGRAETFFRQSVDEDETYAKAHYYLGLTMYKLHDSQSAVRAWKRASEVDPGGPMGLKAERKLNYVKGHLDRTVTELRDRLR